MKERIVGLIKGLQFFVSKEIYEVDAQHDIVYAGIDSAPNEEEANQLKEWGWHLDKQNDCWGFFT